MYFVPILQIYFVSLHCHSTNNNAKIQKRLEIGMNDVLRCTKSNKLNLKFIVMGCTKSNKSPKVGVKKNAFIELVDLWKRDVNWESYTDKGRKICIGFGISLTAVMVFCHTWLFIPAIIGLLCCLSSLKDLNVEE